MRAAALGLARTALLACGDGSAPGPPPEVAVAVAVKEEVPVTYETTGRTEAYSFAELRAQVAGVLQRVVVPEAAIHEDWRGSFVMIVDAENRIERRRVVTGSPHGNERILEEGVAAASGDS